MCQYPTTKKQDKLNNLIDIIYTHKMNGEKENLKEYIILVINKAFDIDEKEEIISRICGTI
jgi:hypothetical protein